jgi:hypothetical protein
VGRGGAYADIDADGDLDVLLTQVGGRPLLLRNDLAPEAPASSYDAASSAGERGRSPRRWLRVKLAGDPIKKSNRDAIGARLELTAGGVTQIRHVMPTRSYLSQVELPVTFGLGAVAQADSLRITWPDGSTQELIDLQAGQLVVIQQE